MAQAPIRYGVIGHPISHSRSPFIHAHFATQVGHAISYEAIDVAPEHFRRDVEALRQQGVRGLNVTVPLKEHAFDYAQLLSHRAQRAAAVNTLVFEADGRTRGDNTDGVGLVRDLTRNLGWPVTAQRVLILGAGGAVRGVMQPLLELRPAELVVANRTPQRAQTLVAEFPDQPVTPVAASLAHVQQGRFDLVINATSAQLAGESLTLGAEMFASGARAYDMMYGAADTPFLCQVRAAGVAHRADGRGMLVEQAAESFFIWRGVAPCTAPVIAALSALLAVRN